MALNLIYEFTSLSYHVILLKYSWWRMVWHDFVLKNGISNLLPIMTTFACISLILQWTKTMKITWKEKDRMVKEGLKDLCSPFLNKWLQMELMSINSKMTLRKYLLKLSFRSSLSLVITIAHVSLLTLKLICVLRF